MPNVLTTAQLQSFSSDLSSFSSGTNDEKTSAITTIYNYLSDNGYGYATLASGLVTGSTLSGDVAKNFMANYAATNGSPMTVDTQVNIELSMAQAYVKTLIDDSQSTGQVSSDITYQEASTFHAAVFSGYNLSPDAWTLYAPGQVLGTSTMENFWSQIISTNNTASNLGSAELFGSMAAEAGNVGMEGDVPPGNTQAANWYANVSAAGLQSLSSILTASSSGTTQVSDASGNQLVLNISGVGGALSDETILSTASGQTGVFYGGQGGTIDLSNSSVTLSANSQATITGIGNAITAQNNASVELASQTINNIVTMATNGTVVVDNGAQGTVTNATTISAGNNTTVNASGTGTNITLGSNSSVALNGTGITVQASADQVSLANGSSATVNGINNIVQNSVNDMITEASGITSLSAAATSSTLTAAAGTNSVTISGIQDAVTVGSTNNTIAIAGNNDQASVTGSGDKANITGNGNTTNLSGSSDTTTVTSTNSTTNVSGNTDVTNVGGSGNISNITGSTDGTAVNGVNDVTTIVGSSDSTIANGTGNTTTINGTQNGTQVSGSNDTTTLLGSGDSTTVSGANSATTVDGIYNTTTVTGTFDTTQISGNADTTIAAGTGNVSNVSGSSDGTTINGSSDATNMQGSSDSTTVNGLADTTTINGTQNGTFVAGSYDTTTLLGSINTTTVGGASNTVTVGGIENTSTVNGDLDIAQISGNADTTTAAGSGNDVNVSGSNDGTYTGGVNDLTNVVGSSDSTTTNGLANITTIYGTQNGTFVGGSNDTTNLTGSNDTTSVYGIADITAVSGGSDATEVSGGFNTTTINSGGLTDNVDNSNPTPTNYNVNPGNDDPINPDDNNNNNDGDPTDGWYFGLSGSANVVAGTLQQGSNNLVSQSDVASGDTSAALRVAGTLSQELSVAKQGNTAAELTGAKWTTSTVTWSLASFAGTATSPFSAYMDSSDTSVLQAAFNAWGAATGLHFSEVSDSTATDIRIGWGNFNTATTGIVGMTESPGNAQSAFTSDAIIRLENPNETALVVGADGAGNTYANTQATLYQSALHEIGHALGFASNADPDSIMNYQLSSSNRTLDATDVSAALTLYQGSAVATTATVNQLIQSIAAFAPAGSVTTSPNSYTDTAVQNLLLAASH